MSEPSLTIEDLLYKVRYKIDEHHPHITVDTEVCRTRCTDHPCTHACPARCFVWEEGTGMVFSYENCLECGTCQYACEPGAVTWNYPAGGMGVSFQFG